MPKITPFSGEYQELHMRPMQRTVVCKPPAGHPIDYTPEYKTYTVPLMTDEDWFGWVDELSEKLRADLVASIPTAIKPKDKEESLFRARRAECTTDHIAAIIRTPRAVHRILTMAAEKLGLTGTEKADFVSGASSRQNMRDAAKISGILHPESFLLEFPEDSGMMMGLVNAARRGDEAGLVEAAKAIVEYEKSLREAAEKAETTPDPKDESPALTT